MMDNMDLKILRVLQEDSSLSVTEVAQRGVIDVALLEAY